MTLQWLVPDGAPDLTSTHPVTAKELTFGRSFITSSLSGSGNVWGDDDTATGHTMVTNDNGAIDKSTFAVAYFSPFDLVGLTQLAVKAHVTTLSDTGNGQGWLEVGLYDVNGGVASSIDYHTHEAAPPGQSILPAVGAGPAWVERASPDYYFEFVAERGLWIEISGFSQHNGASELQVAVHELQIYANRVPTGLRGEQIGSRRIFLGS